MHINSYQSQDRGTQSDYGKYLTAMDAIAVEKVASASVFFDPKPGNTIVDIGMASGTSSNILALLFPQVNVIGVDINPVMVEIAQKTYHLPNLDFRIDDGEKLNSFKSESVNGFFNCSSIHHITSFNDYDSNRAYNTIKRQVELLKDGGIIVVRDFVKPPEMEVILEVSNLMFNSKISDAELLISFSQKARSLANKNETGFPIKEIAPRNNNCRCFQLYYADAVEFIRRKDYYENWEVELQEEYGYYTQKDFEDIFASLGLRVIISNPIYNPWIIRNRYKGKFTLYDINGKDIGFPPTNYLIAGEKINKSGTKLMLLRHLPESDNSFLKYQSFLDSETSKIYDVVQRPNSVVDIIPYIYEDGRINILAKHGYPRPLVNLNTGSSILDQKYYSGYITEGITATYNHNIEIILSERTNLKAQNIKSKEKSLEYYTSPGGIDEKVESYLVELQQFSIDNSTSNANFSGFSNPGVIRKFDALQLLKTAQTGALAEARLELNIYYLLKKLNINLPQWMGERIEIKETIDLETITLTELLGNTYHNFSLCMESANFLEKHRAKFIEEGIAKSSNILEYVIPKNKSINTLITLPVTIYKNEVFVGLEIRNLPVPQLHTNNSYIAVAPATRIPKDCSTLKELENYISNLNIFGFKIISFNKLGEKFFPSVGVTPEQVYPFVVTLSDITKDLKWVSLKELYNNPQLIKDGHLLISVFRLYHALTYS